MTGRANDGETMAKRRSRDMTRELSENMEDGPEWRVLAEWDWVRIDDDVDGRLHAVREMVDTLAEIGANWGGAGVTECGRTGWLEIPGVFSRMRVPRCRECCRATGMPYGSRSPVNVAGCPPVVERRLRTLGLDVQAPGWRRRLQAEGRGTAREKE